LQSLKRENTKIQKSEDRHKSLEVDLILRGESNKGKHSKSGIAEN